MSPVSKNGLKVAIVGAGLSGLICGMRLSKAGFDVHIIESLSTPGGLLASTRMGKEAVELVPHHIRKTDKALLSLIKECGIDNKLEWFDSLWYGKASRKKVGYFTDGFSALTHRLIQDITDNGGTIFYSTTVSDITVAHNIDDDNTKYNISCILPDLGRKIVECDYLIYTGSCRSFATASTSVPMEINVRDQLLDITYTSSISLMMILKRQQSEVYFQNTTDSMPFSRIVNHTNCFGLREYGGNIVYLVGNCQVTDPIWVGSDEEVFKTYFAAFRKLYPSIKKSDVKDWRLKKIRYANANKYSVVDLSNPAEHLYVCNASLSKYDTKDTATNRMEHVVALANAISHKIIEDYLEHTRSTEELS